MKLKLTTLALAIATLASAQEVTVVSHEQLLRGVESQCYSPVISSDGTKVLFTGERYSGLKLYDITNDVTTRIADDAMAGFKPAFSPSADKVYYLSQTTKDMLTYRSVKCFDLASAKSTDITDPERGMRSPVATSAGLITVSDNGRQLRGKAAGTTAYTDGSQIVVATPTGERTLRPVDTKYSYLWTSLSPDGSKILFYAGGVGAFVCDLQGNLLGSYGRCSSPSWCGNNHIVVCRETSDGHQYESACLEIVRLDGNYSQRLTAPESMSFAPSASADGSRLVYNTIDGRLFLMQLNIK